MEDFAGKVIGVLITLFGTVILVFANITSSADSYAKRTIMNEMQQLCDKVIDTRELTEDQLADFYLSISGLGPTVDAEVVRYVRVVNPDPKKPGGLYTTFVYSENNTEYNQGDKVRITVKAIRYTGPQRILYGLVRIKSRDINYTITERVR